jgi:hypothetical protein
MLSSKMVRFRGPQTTMKFMVAGIGSDGPAILLADGE